MASHTMARDIFEWPWERSVKVIGTSAMRSPARSARQVFSIWKQ